MDNAIKQVYPVGNRPEVTETMERLAVLDLLLDTLGPSWRS